MKLKVFKEINDKFDSDNEVYHHKFDKLILELLKVYAPAEIYEEAKYVYENNEFWYA